MSKSMVAVITAVITAVVSVCSTLVVVKYTGEDGTEKEVRAEIQYEENGGEGAGFEPYELSGSQQTVSGDTSMYKVDIKSARISYNYEGKKSIVVTFNFTNNSNETVCFEDVIDEALYQNGVSLEETNHTESKTDPFGYDHKWQDLKPGVSYDVELGYILNDDTTSVDVEVRNYKYSDSNDFLVSRTFTLS